MFEPSARGNESNVIELIVVSSDSLEYSDAHCRDEGSSNPKFFLLARIIAALDIVLDGKLRNHSSKRTFKVMRKGRFEEEKGIRRGEGKGAEENQKDRREEKQNFYLVNDIRISPGGWKKDLKQRMFDQDEQFPRPKDWIKKPPVTKSERKRNIERKRE